MKHRTLTSANVCLYECIFQTCTIKVTRDMLNGFNHWHNRIKVYNHLNEAVQLLFKTLFHNKISGKTKVFVGDSNLTYQ